MGPSSRVGLRDLVHPGGVQPAAQPQGDGEIGVGPLLGSPGGKEGHRPEHPPVFQGDLALLGLDDNPLQLGQKPGLKRSEERRVGKECRL